MTEIIGRVYSGPKHGTWEVWSNGAAYSESTLNRVAYRWPDGYWRYGLVNAKAAVISADSEKLEKVFSDYINKIIVGPVDPLRHLRKK